MIPLLKRRHCLWPQIRKKTQLPTSMSCGIRGSSGASWGDERLLKQKDRIMQHHTLLPPSAEWTSAVVPTLVLWASQVCLRREVENGSSFLSGWEQVYQSWGRECLKKKVLSICQTPDPALRVLTHLIPKTAQWGSYFYHPHFTDKVTDA